MNTDQASKTTAASSRLDRGVRPLPRAQASLLDALRNGVVLRYMPYMGSFNSSAYYFRDDTHQRVTASAKALLEKGLAEKYDETLRGHRVRAKALPAA